MLLKLNPFTIEKNTNQSKFLFQLKKVNRKTPTFSEAKTYEKKSIGKKRSRELNIYLIH